MTGATDTPVPMMRMGVLCLTLLCAACGDPSRAPETSQGPAPSPAVAGRGYKVGKPYQIKGIWYYPAIDYEYSEVGIASWYGPGFHGRSTANGETYDMNDLTAAHRTLPMPCIVRVTNLENGRSLRLRVNDRGPYVGDRIIDVSRRGAQLLGFFGAGTARVHVEIVEDESRQLAAALGAPPEALAVRSTASNGSVTVASASAFADLAALSGTAELATSIAGGAVVEAPVFEPVSAYADIGSVPAAIDPFVPSAEAAMPAPDTFVAAPFPAPVYEAPPSGGLEQSSVYVQAGAFADQARAGRVRQRLAVIGPTVLSPSWSNGRELLRVRVGPLKSEAEAERVLAWVNQAGFPDARVVTD